MQSRQPLFSSMARLFIMAFTVLAACVFWQASQYAIQKNSEFNLAVENHNSAQQFSADYHKLTQQYQQFVALNEQRNAVSDDIKLAALQQQHWLMRDLEVKSAAIPRKNIMAYLTSASNQPDYYFLPQRFELRVPFAEDDIFLWSKGDSKTLNLTLSGQYYIRRQQ